MLKMMPLNLWKTSFRMEGLQKITNTRGAGKCKNISKGCQKITQIYEKWTLELNKKSCLKTDPQKSTNVQKTTPKSVPKSEVIFGVAPRRAPLGAQLTQK